MIRWRVADARGRLHAIPPSRIGFFRFFRGGRRELQLEMIRAAMQRSLRNPLDSDRLAAWIDEVRLCPACGYDLGGSERADDGCLVCPECGGAWRALPRCGACGYDLTGLPASGDAGVVCPECGEPRRRTA